MIYLQLPDSFWYLIEDHPRPVSHLTVLCLHVQDDGHAVLVLVTVTALSLPLYSPLSHLLSTCLLLLTQSLRFRYIISIITDSNINKVLFLVIIFNIDL